jgi:uncharacterized membrane protein
METRGLQPVERESDARFGLTLGRVLRAGVLLAATLVAAGAVIYLARNGASVPAYQAFRGEPTSLRRVGGILREAGAPSGRGLIQLGLLVLIATPVVRVLFAIVGFARQRDWLYVCIATIVLLLLVFSLAGS